MLRAGGASSIPHKAVTSFERRGVLGHQVKRDNDGGVCGNAPGR